MYKAKVLLIGPVKCGKTVIANVLSESRESAVGDYHPTKGVRILEFEVQGVNIGHKNVSTEIELWDCSGDSEFESCWPAMAKDSGGVIIVCNPELGKEQDKELQGWYSHYIEQQSLRESQCIIFAHSQSSDSADSRKPQLSGPIGRLPIVKTSLEDDGELLKREFKTFLGKLFSTLSERMEQDEMTILNSRA